MENGITVDEIYAREELEVLFDYQNETYFCQYIKCKDGFYMNIDEKIEGPFIDDFESLKMALKIIILEKEKSFQNYVRIEDAVNSWE